MYFNPDPIKKSKEYIFSQRSQKKYSRSLLFSQNPKAQDPLQKHLGIFLDTRLNFSGHIKTMIQRTNKTIVFLPKLLMYYPGLLCSQNTNHLFDVLLNTVILYDQTYNNSF